MIFVFIKEHYTVRRLGHLASLILNVQQAPSLLNSKRPTVTFNRPPILTVKGMLHFIYSTVLSNKNNYIIQPNYSGVMCILTINVTNTSPCSMSLRLIKHPSNDDSPIFTKLLILKRTVISRLVKCFSVSIVTDIITGSFFQLILNLYQYPATSRIIHQLPHPPH